MTANRAVQQAQTTTAQVQDFTPVATYDIDPAHSAVEFGVKHLMISTTTGRFRKFKGVVEFDRADPSRSRVEADIEASSIDTDMPQRDDHLRSPDFLDAPNHPTLTFRSRRVEPSGPDAARVVGDLTIRGVTREVALAVEKEGEAKDPWGNQRAAFVATTTFSREAFGLTWNAALETGGVLVGDKVKVTLRIEGVQRKD